MTSVFAAMLLVITPPEAPAPPESPITEALSEPAPLKEPARSRRHASEGAWNALSGLLWVGLPVSAIGLGVCSWVGREHDAGLGCSIAAGSGALGVLLPTLVWLGLAKNRYIPEPAGIALLVAANVAGLVGGGLLTWPLAEPPGAQRGVVGVGASGLFLVSVISIPFFLLLPLFW